MCYRVIMLFNDVVDLYSFLTNLWNQFSDQKCLSTGAKVFCQVCCWYSCSEWCWMGQFLKSSFWGMEGRRLDSYWEVRKYKILGLRFASLASLGWGHSKMSMFVKDINIFWKFHQTFLLHFLKDLSTPIVIIKKFPM